jgi:ABC transporter substrate binding protein
MQQSPERHVREHLGAAIAWTRAARAQQAKLHRVGTLLLGIADAGSFQTELRGGLRNSGYVEGKNLARRIAAAELHGKFVELFRDMLPSLRRVALLLNAEDPFWRPVQEQVQLAGRAMGIEIAPSVMVRGPNEIDAAFADMRKAGADAVVVHGSLSNKQVAELALKHRLPSATQSRSFAEVGGLMSYDPDGPDVFRRSALFVAKILEGSKPANMPVEQPTKFKLVINVRTAMACHRTCFSAPTR